MTIKVGTICLVRYAPSAPDAVGKICEVTARIPRDELGHDCWIRFLRPIRIIGGSVQECAAADICLIPIAPPGNPDKVDERIKTPEMVSV